MTMSINTNLMALRAQRNLDVTQAKMSTALEQLSTGRRINSAADDAAGMAISQRLNTQVGAMQQGLRNAQNAISMIQTALGATSQTTAILQRMRSLAVQASSTTLSSVDRNAIGVELVALRTELDNIATSTRFNGLNLLTGTLTTTASGTITTNTISNGTANVTTDVTADTANPADTYTLSGSGSSLTITDSTAGISQTLTVPDFTTAGSQQLDFSALGINLNLTATGPITGASMVSTGTNPLGGATLSLTGTGTATYRTGSDLGDAINVSFADVRSSALGSGPSTMLNQLVTGPDAVSTVTKANTLLSSVDAAIDQVSSVAARMGAAQNQMQAATQSLGISVQNLTASESTLRDADIAQASSNLVASQILQQAGVAVLQQANAIPQAVLQLLK